MTPRLDPFEELRKRVGQAPTSPGIYRWLNSDGEVLYIGKAKNVRDRLRSYLPVRQAGVQKEADVSLGPWKLSLRKHIADFDVTVTSNELEALILETNLIKETKPKYNVMMKDDKNYVYVRISDEKYPDITVVRRMDDDGAKYFGPYLSSYYIKHTLDTLHEIFRFRSCRQSIEAFNRGKQPARGCMQQQIGQCNGLCVGAVRHDAYIDAVRHVIRFLKGNYDEASDKVQEMMLQAAADKKFERAAKLRNTLQYIESLRTTQVVSDTSGENTDAIGVALQQGKSQVVVLRERNGKLIDERSFALTGGADRVSPVISELIPQYYAAETDIPDLILIQEDIKDRSVLQDWLRQVRGKKTEIRAPERGKKSKLLAMAERNAEQKITQQFAKWEAAAKNIENALKELKDVLGLDAEPKRIEGYDISHLGGTETVGSMVVMKNGKPANKEYRSFTLRTVKEGEIDDYKALKEVLRRRLRHLGNTEQQWKERGVNIGKAKKSDEQLLKETIGKYPGTLEPDTVNYKNFVVARKDDAIVGFAALVNNHPNLTELDPLWISDDYRGSRLGHALCKKLLVKQKGKVYILCKPKLEDYFAQIGFHFVREGPEILHTKIQDFVTRYKQEPEIMMMIESKNQKSDVSLSSTPDLLVIDGGKGQLSAVTEVLKEFDMKIPVIGLAKREEEVFLPEQSLPVDLRSDSPASFLLQRLRDEAHRFANAHREKRLAKGMIASALDGVPGIGEKTRKELLKKFGSVEHIKTASDADLLSTVNAEQLKHLRATL